MYKYNSMQNIITNTFDFVSLQFLPTKSKYWKVTC